MSKDTKLDANQVIKMVYDEVTQSLKTTVGGSDGDGLTNAELRASPIDVIVTSAPPTTILVDAIDDSIAIGDRLTGDLMGVNPDGSINTNIVGVTPISGRLPVDLGASVVNITGPVTIPGEVEVINDVGNPLSVQATVLPLPTGASTSALQTTANNSLASIDFKLTNPLEISGSVSVDNFPASQDVVVTSSTLPTGAATSALQTTGNASLASIDSKLTSPLQIESTDLDIRDLAFATDKVDVSGSAVSVTNFPASQDVVVTSSVLPTGASTLAEQQAQTSQLDTAVSQLASIDSKLTSPITVQATNLDIRDLTFISDKVDVTGSTVALDSTTLAALENINVTVLNEVEVKNDVGNPLSVTMASSPLPTGAATEATLADLNSKVVTVDTDNVTIVSTILAPDAATETEQQAQTVLLTNIDTNLIKADTDNVTIIASALPTGAATLAEQQSQTGQLDTMVSQLASIDSKLTSPLTVQATNLDIRDLAFATDKVDVSNSVVALDAATLAALENTTVTVANPGITDAELRAAPVPVSGTVSVDNFPASQDVVVTSSALPTGAATLALQSTGNASLSSIDSKLTSPLAVTGPLTDSQLRDSPVPVSGTIAVSNPGLTDTQLRASAVPVSLTSTTITSSALPTGASTSSLQTSGNSSLSSIDTKTPALGQALAAASVPVVLTAAQIATLTPLSSVSVNNFPATQPVSAAALPLPSGASTSALQTTGNNSLASIDSKLTAPLAVTGSVNVNRVAIVGSAPATANVTTASTIVVPANASRKGLTIINLTNTRVFLSFESNAATVNSGIMLANGGSFSMDNFSFTLGAVRAIVASGNSILSIQEFA